MSAPAEALSSALAESPGASPGAVADGPAQGSTLAFLLRRMQRKADFPALSEHVGELNRKLATPDDASANELANTILKDYALTTKLLRLVNSSYYGPYSGRISTVSRAVVILGLRQVRAAALSLLLFDHVEDRAQAETLRTEAGKSFLAGALGRQLALRAGGADPEQVFICAMFANLGRYLAAYYFPEEHAEIRQAIGRGSDEAEASLAVLGVTFEALGTAVAREWQMPGDILASMERPPAGPLPAPEGTHDRLRQLSALSNELTEALGGSATPSERGAALTALRGRYRRAFPLPDDLLEEVASGALDDLRSYVTSTEAAVLRALAPSENLKAWLRSVRGEGPESSASAAGATGGAAADRPSAAAPDRGDGPHATLLAGIQDVSQAILEGAGLNDILVMVLETAYRGLGLSRVALLIRDRRDGCLSSRFGLGADIERVSPHLRFCPAQGPDPFSRAYAEQREVVRVGLTTAPARADLPAWYTGVLNPDAVALLPVVLNRVCLGLLYADRDEAGRGFTSSDVNYLVTLRNQAVLAIRQGS
jgi:HD-like signal output (HDOD) protein